MHKNVTEQLSNIVFQCRFSVWTLSRAALFEHMEFMRVLENNVLQCIQLFKAIW